MDGPKKKLTTAVETYFTDLGRVCASGGATRERSTYGPLANFLNAVGLTLRPKVFCVGEPADQGAGHPDFGLYAAKQVQRGRPRKGQTPERGVVEVKSVDDDTWLTAQSDQVSRYWQRYGLVLVTNTRDFVLVGKNAAGRLEKLETFRLADSADHFHRKLDKPRAFAREVGAGLGEYLCRALSHETALAEPKDLAWLLASYARDGLARVEAAGDAPSLGAVRSALEEALGVRFEGKKGARFFHSTLVQTLFYGIFSAWVLWSGASAKSDDGPLFADAHRAARFDWRTAVWHLRAPVLRALFQQLSDPGRLQPLGLVEVLDWDSVGPRPGGPARLLRPLQRGRGRALLLRAVPGSLRPRSAQAVGRLVHSGGGGSLHGRPRGQGAQRPISASPTASPRRTSMCSIPAAAPGPISLRCCAV